MRNDHQFHRNAQRRHYRLWSILYSINLSGRLELKDISIVITDLQSVLLEISMKNTMRNTLLVTVAATALIAGAGLASAQGTGETREAPGAATHEPKAPGGKMDQQPNGAPQKAPAPNAQAPMKPAPTAQAPAKETPAPTAQAPTKEKPAETAQAPSAAKPQAAEHGGNAQTSEPPNSRMAPGTARDETKSGPPAALSTEQHAKIRDTLRIEKSERLASVPFSTKVGEAVPGTVHLYVLPVSILEYAPQYRGYEYILVGDDILIVDPRTHRIVAVIAA
jgi:Protein of unknown function (DUF1236)